MVMVVLFLRMMLRWSSLPLQEWTGNDVTQTTKSRGLHQIGKIQNSTRGPMTSGVCEKFHKRPKSTCQTALA
jgi:hypothetical protein